MHWIEDNHALEYLGEIGIILVMFALGFEENVENFLKGLKKAWGIATIGAIFPFFTGYYMAQLFGFGFTSSMLWGLTMTATAVSLTMMSLKSLGLHKTTAATGIMTAAVVDDVLSLIGVAIIVPIILASSATGSNGSFSFDIMEIGWILMKVVLFFAIVYFVGKYFFPHKGGVKGLFRVEKGEYLTLAVILVAIVMGTLAELFGFHPAIGAYFAGLLIKKEYFEDEESQATHFLEGIINNLAFVVFGPVFFVLLGTHIVLDVAIIKEVIFMSLALFAAVLVFQILSAGLAARYTGGYGKEDSILIGLGMLGRAELAFIVINIAYVQNKLISQQEFYILIFTAFLLNITVPIVIKLYKPFYEKGTSQKGK
jgi:Kef-type K+ transport system membrane component KefB